MSIYTNIQDYWKKQLERVDPQDPSLLTLPEDTNSFLTSVGLPIDPSLLKIPLGFYFTPKSLQAYRLGKWRYVSIGTNQVADIAIREDGKVFLISQESNIDSQQTRLINSNIAKFLMSTIEYLKILPELTNDVQEHIKPLPSESYSIDEAIRIRQHTKNRLLATLDRLEEKLMEIDPIALSDHESLWNIVIENGRL